MGDLEEISIDPLVQKLEFVAPGRVDEPDNARIRIGKGLQIGLGPKAEDMVILKNIPEPPSMAVTNDSILDSVRESAAGGSDCSGRRFYRSVSGIGCGRGVSGQDPNEGHKSGLDGAGELRGVCVNPTSCPSFFTTHTPSGSPEEAAERIRDRGY